MLKKSLMMSNMSRKDIELEEEQHKEPIKWISSIVLDDQIIDFNKYSDGKFIPILLDLVLYKSQDLIDLGFEILCNHFTQQMQLAEQLQDIQIIENEKQINIYMLVQDNLSEFQ